MRVHYEIGSPKTCLFFQRDMCFSLGNENEGLG